MPLTNGVPYHFSTKWSNGVSNGVHEAVNSTHEAINRYNSKSSLLERAGDDELHDIVCVGFGPAALSIAVALNDSIEAKDPSLRTLSPKVRFIERQPTYQWHPGMLLEDSKMQITFMKDMATLRNPRSHFTFVNYLHNQQRLVQFTNLNTMLPKRLEYNDYMRWCASAFDSVVEYGRSVVRIEAVETDSSNAAVQSFRVVSTNSKTGETTELRAKHVIIAVGGRPYIPKALKIAHPRIIHSSQYMTEAASLFKSSQQPQRIAVVGAGQSAAEIFCDIPSKFPCAQSVLVTRRTALRPSDDSPFVNEVFDPSRTDDVFAQSPEVRDRAIAADRATNYGVVRLDLLEHLYSTFYTYNVKHLPEESWPHRIANLSTVTSVQQAKAGTRDVLRLGIQNESQAYGRSIPQYQELDVDMVIVACGYERNVHEDLIQDLQPLRPEGDSSGWKVNRNYAVNFLEGALEEDRGIWLQGCNEKTHGLPDSLLSLLSVRAGEVVNSILGAPDVKKTMVDSVLEVAGH